MLLRPAGREPQMPGKQLGLAGSLE